MPANFTSKRNPAYVELVDDAGAPLGTDANPVKVASSSGGSGTQDVIVTNTNANPVPVVSTPLNLFGEATKSVTTTPDFVSISGCAFLLLSAAPDNTDTIMYGSQTAQVFYLTPGQTIQYYDDTVYFKSVTGTQNMGIGGFTNS
jgi:hypothetical protein